MNKKLLIVCLALVAIVCFSSTVSAGWFDWGEEEVQNKTFTFEGGCSLELPEDVSILNLSETNDYGNEINTHIIMDNHTDSSYTFAVSTGDSIVASTDEYYSNVIGTYPGATLEGDYNGWTIIDLHNDGDSDDTSSRYHLALVDGTTIYLLIGDDLTVLKNVADTFKK